ncbi:uncharacterized protein LOC126316795 [Schistocerca gregaria]|uniref:uncharacterized protein LOC126316795 n=1 Tax=Schistocerca gregaria TaxID=7010 RepID=UPI00211E754C|nr:uncharacterized protein LOC126316795 [Schistocerca gregaria]
MALFGTQVASCCSRVPYRNVQLCFSPRLTKMLEMTYALIAENLQKPATSTLEKFCECLDSEDERATINSAHLVAGLVKVEENVPVLLSILVHGTPRMAVKVASTMADVLARGDELSFEGGRTLQSVVKLDPEDWPKIAEKLTAFEGPPDRRIEALTFLTALANAQNEALKVVAFEVLGVMLRRCCAQEATPRERNACLTFACGLLAAFGGRADESEYFRAASDARLAEDMVALIGMGAHSKLTSGNLGLVLKVVSSFLSVEKVARFLSEKTPIVELVVSIASNDELAFASTLVTSRLVRVCGYLMCGAREIDEMVQNGVFQFISKCLDSDRSWRFAVPDQSLAARDEVLRAALGTLSLFVVADYVPSGWLGVVESTDLIGRVYGLTHPSNAQGVRVRAIAAISNLLTISDFQKLFSKAGRHLDLLALLEEASRLSNQCEATMYCMALTSLYHLSLYHELIQIELVKKGIIEILSDALHALFRKGVAGVCNDDGVESNGKWAVFKSLLNFSLVRGVADKYASDRVIDTLLSFLNGDPDGQPFVETVLMILDNLALEPGFSLAFMKPERISALVETLISSGRRASYCMVLVQLIMKLCRVRECGTYICRRYLKQIEAISSSEESTSTAASLLRTLTALVRWSSSGQLKVSGAIERPRVGERPVETQRAPAREDAAREKARLGPGEGGFGSEESATSASRKDGGDGVRSATSSREEEVKSVGAGTEKGTAAATKRRQEWVSASVPALGMGSRTASASPMRSIGHMRLVEKSPTPPPKRPSSPRVQKAASGSSGSSAPLDVGKMGAADVRAHLPKQLNLRASAQLLREDDRMAKSVDEATRPSTVLKVIKYFEGKGFGKRNYPTRAGKSLDLETAAYFNGTPKSSPDVHSKNAAASRGRNYQRLIDVRSMRVSRYEESPPMDTSSTEDVTNFVERPELREFDFSSMKDQFVLDEEWEKLDSEFQKSNSKRNKIIRELYSTEITYVDNLSILIKKFYRPLLYMANGPKPLISESDLRIIFSSIEIIYSFHFILLERLNEKLKNWNPDTTLSDVFFFLADFIKIYAGYINNYDRAIEMLTDYRQKDPRAREFLDKGLQDPECGMRSLDSFLIMPVQRPPRYLLLFIELIKHTDPSHPDREVSDLALKKLKMVVSYLNENRKAVEYRRCLIELSEANNISEYTDFIFQPHRQLKASMKVSWIQEGVERIFYGSVCMFNDALLLCKQKSTSSKRNIFGVVMFANVTSHSLEKDVLQFTCGNLKDTIKLIFPSQEEGKIFHRRYLEITERGSCSCSESQRS